MARPLVSVIIPTYNREGFIEQTIESVLDQTYDNLEIIISDDGSTDNTRAVVRKMKDKRIKFHLNEHNGLPAFVRNRGIEQSRGEFIAFLDSDDLWLPAKLERQFAEFKKNSGLGLVCTNGIDFDENGEHGLRIKADLDETNFTFDGLLLKDNIICSSVMVKRTVLDDVGDFNESRKVRAGEDYELWLRVARKHKIKYIKEPLIKYRSHADVVRKDELGAHTTLLKNIFKSLLDKKILSTEHYNNVVNRLEHRLEYDELYNYIIAENNSTTKKFSEIVTRISEGDHIGGVDKLKLFSRWFTNMISPSLSEKIASKFFVIRN